VTRDRKRKAAVREAQRITGRRYTALAREMQRDTGKTFVLAELLAECATLPPAFVDWDFPSSSAPAVFDSRLLGTVVPYGAVMELSGTLAHEGPQAAITLESLRPEFEAVVACRDRRLQIVLTQDSVYDLCRTPGCPHQPVGWSITLCEQHLPECEAKELIRMARGLGYDRREFCEQAPTRLEGSPEADLLIKAAVAQGLYEPVSAVFLLACFGDPNLYDDEFSDAADSLAMEHALERERLRLHGVGSTEARRLRGTSKSCANCGQHLHGWNPKLPPRVCFKCAPPPSAERQFLTFTV
jgi:hypothetical protein